MLYEGPLLAGVSRGLAWRVVLRLRMSVRCPPIFSLLRPPFLSPLFIFCLFVVVVVLFSFAGRISRGPAPPLLFPSLPCLSLYNYNKDKAVVLIRMCELAGKSMVQRGGEGACWINPSTLSLCPLPFPPFASGIPVVALNPCPSLSHYVFSGFE